VRHGKVGLGGEAAWLQSMRSAQPGMAVLRDKQGDVVGEADRYVEVGLLAEAAVLCLASLLVLTIPFHCGWSHS
jgi:hypothetical protein